MGNSKALMAYEQLAEQYARLIDHKPHNAYYDRPNTLSLLPDVAGKAVLDAGCGPGKYAEILLAQGAKVTGFDLSPRMVAAAQARTGRPEAFFVHDMSAPLPQFADGSFDIVLSALALDYVEDWAPVMQEFCRLLRPNGLLVCSISHPFFDHTFFEGSRYFEVEEKSCVWKGFGIPVEVHHHRRSLGEVIRPITENGFYIDQLLEPRPVPEFERHDPRHFKELNEFPSFLCIRAVRRPTFQ